MFWFRLLIVTTLCGLDWTMSIAQENATPLPEIWKAIEQDAEVIAKLGPQTTYRHTNRAREAAERIARGRSRSSIDTLFKSVADLDKLPERDEPKNLKAWMKSLAAYVVAEIADPDGSCGLRSWVGDLNTAGIVGMDCYHDDESRAWLFKIVSDKLDDQSDAHARFDTSFFIALQLLRGYQPDEGMRQMFEQALQAEPALIDQVSRDARDHLRSVLSAWDYAARLEDPTVQARYREFQSLLWRSWAIGPKGFRGKDGEYSAVASMLLGRNPFGGFYGLSEAKSPPKSHWQQGDEQFVLHIFENPASTHDELKIAVYLAHKLPDTKKLRSIAESDSPQASYASEAIQLIERQRQRSEQ